MSALLNLDQQTMFALNALLLLVFATAFAFAGIGRKDRLYWAYMVISNIIFAISFLVFSQKIRGSTADLFLPNLLIFIGLSFRWIAIREFYFRSGALRAQLVVPSAAVLAYLSWPLVGFGTVFGTINLLISVQIIVIIATIVCEKEDLKSKWGLIASYAVLVLSSLLRVLQGWIFDPTMGSLLPSDIFLQLNLVAAAIHISASGAFSLLIAYERSVNNLSAIALRDPLSGLLNRWSIEAFANRDTSKSPAPKLSIIMIDIDYFKLINDTYGHAAGDAAIKHCANLISETFPAENLIARVGGEEFMVIAPDRSSAWSAEYAGKFRHKLLAEPFHHNGEAIPFTVSIGICTGHVNSSAEFDALWNCADNALYAAKSSGRDKTEVGDCE
jgi:diguanylate cyclase (GGDEF)-like protein